MRPLVSPQAMAKADQATIDKGTPSTILMERAGRAVARAVVSLLGARYGMRVAVVCGKGNNGGDGFVVARALRREGLGVTCIGVADADAAAGAAKEHLERMRSSGIDMVPYSPSAIDGVDAIVDAIFGTGFKGRIEGGLADVVAAIARSGAPVVAIDIPSGVNGETGAIDGPAVRADLTVTMAAEKLGTAVGPGAVHAGRVVVADIGIDVSHADALVPETEDLRNTLPVRAPDAHKRSGGAVALLAGSTGMTGAAVLAARGALRMGAGYVTLGGVRSTVAAVASAAPEVLTRVVGDGDDLGPEALDDLGAVLKEAGALGLGPGLRQTERQRDLVRRVLDELPIPLVLDADALNVLVEDTQALVGRSGPTIITPHPGEMARLLGLDVNGVQADRLGAATEAARRFDCVALLKGPRTVVARPEGIPVVNPTGTPGLATAGTGDVLTGALTTLLAAGLEPFDAAWAAAYVHGLAGEIAAGDAGAEGVMAGDVADRLPLARRRAGGDHPDGS